MLRRFSCTTFAFVLISCGSQQSTAPPTVPVGPTPSPLWQIDRDDSPQNWRAGTGGNCGEPTFPTDSSASFDLKRNGTACLRNQLMPLAGENFWFLTPEKTYTWKFETVANLGDVPTLVWQIHPLNGCSDVIPFASLNSGPHGSGVAWSANVGGYNGQNFYLSYSGNGSVDTWKIQALISNGSNASTTMWHNGTTWFTSTKPNYSPGCGAPWWNFGPYVPGWKNPTYHGPVNEVSTRFNYMELSSP
jgi:hypothetical protein